jgi:chromosome partitioning protein
MPPCYALANQKGGVGKTTTVLNLGAALAELGKRVLVIDLDPQGSLTASLGGHPDELEKTIYHALLQEEISLREVLIRGVKPGLDLAPANPDLAAAELLLRGENRGKTLRKALSPVKGSYDYLLIDCPPSLGLLTVNALAASDGAIVPVSCSFLSLRGLRQLSETIGKVKRELNPRLELTGILLTQFDRRTRHAKEVVDRVRQFYGRRVFRTVIPRTVRFDEAPVLGQSILEYAKDSPGALAYQKLAKEVIKP